MTPALLVPGQAPGRDTRLLARFRPSGRLSMSWIAAACLLLPGAYASVPVGRLRASLGATGRAVF